MTVLPTRKDEAWRYSDIEAVASLWPVPAPTVVDVAAGEARRDVLHASDGIRDFAVTLHAGASFEMRLLNTAERYSRVALDVTLHRGARFDLGAVQVAGGGATVEIVTTVRHAEPDATSRQVVRSVLGDTATGSYLGKVAVARGAQHTDSEQAVRAMLLSRGATANAKPELEIYADDVKCAHGCAIGELDAGALFYLASRGMPEPQAKQLLLQAFVAEVFEGAETLEAAALDALGRLV
jgi:Fe-S cluster assembly protein SufD